MIAAILQVKCIVFLRHSVYVLLSWNLHASTGTSIYSACLNRDKQWRRQDLVPGEAHAKVTGSLQEATVDMQSLSDFVQVRVH